MNSVYADFAMPTIDPNGIHTLESPNIYTTLSARRTWAAQSFVAVTDWASVKKP
jgi:hypothetical protein